MFREKLQLPFQQQSPLFTIYPYTNIAWFRSAGIGTSHSAQVFGYECSHNVLNTYFLKMTELRDRFTVVRQTVKVSKGMNSLVLPLFLIISEVGHCIFYTEKTRIFFNLVEHRYNKCGSLQSTKHLLNGVSALTKIIFTAMPCRPHIYGLQDKRRQLPQRNIRSLHITNKSTERSNSANIPRV